MRKKTKFIILIGIIVSLLVIFLLVNFIIYKTGHNSLIWKIENKQSENKQNDKQEEKKKHQSDKEEKELEQNDESVSKNDEKNENIYGVDSTNTTSNSASTNSSNNGTSKSNGYTSNSNNNTSSKVTPPSSSTNTNSSTSTPSNPQTPQQPAKDPNAVDTTHPLYPSHHGVINYYTLEDCNNAGFDKSFADPNISSFSCVEVYSNSGNVLGYYLEIRY